jgi:hypothetical protein
MRGLFRETTRCLGPSDASQIACAGDEHTYLATGWAIACGSDSGTALTKWKDAPAVARPISENVGYLAVTMNIGPLVLTNIGPPSGI